MVKQCWSGKGYLEVDKGKKTYVVCNECGRLIRLDKPILGSLHLCVMESR